MKRSMFVLGSLAVVSILVLSLVALGADMLTGTWKLNVAKSKYSPANLAPKSVTTKFETVPGGVKTTDTVDYMNRKVHTEYTAKLDGKDVAVKATIDGKPSPDQDGVMWKKIDDFTYETTTMLKGKALLSSKVVISKDGKTRTNTQTGKNAQG